MLFHCTLRIGCSISPEVSSGFKKSCARNNKYLSLVKKETTHHRNLLRSCLLFYDLLGVKYVTRHE